VWGAFVLSKLEPVINYHEIETVTILAGQRYIDPIEGQLSEWGCKVRNPNEGLRPGERYSALVDELQSGEQSTLESY
jgi:hypothetical protein